MNCNKIAEEDAARADTARQVIEDLLKHAVYDRERSDECIQAVKDAEEWLES